MGHNMTRLCQFQEKNTNVGIAVGTALTYMHKYCWHLQEVQEDVTGESSAWVICGFQFDAVILGPCCVQLTTHQSPPVEAMGHANPKVKEETYKWLTAAVSQVRQ